VCIVFSVMKDNFQPKYIELLVSFVYKRILKASQLNSSDLGSKISRI
jgi:hypothetical protein